MTKFVLNSLNYIFYTQISHHEKYSHYNHKRFVVHVTQTWGQFLHDGMRLFSNLAVELGVDVLFVNVVVVSFGASFMATVCLPINNITVKLNIKQKYETKGSYTK